MRNFCGLLIGVFLASQPVDLFAQGASQSKEKALEKAYNASVDFWGKVVDQNGNPVEGADVKFTINTDPDPYGKLPEVHVLSNPAGLFSLTGKNGLSLAVWVSKEGYYSSSTRSAMNLNYSLRGVMAQPFPTLEHPAIFRLQKRGQAANLVNKHFQIPIPKDGTPIEIDLAKGQIIKSGPGDIEISTWVTDNGHDVVHPYPWKCQVSIPKGGLLQRSDELDFIAPSDGYQPQDEMTMTRDSAHWRREMKREYFLRIGDGCYARMDFWMVTGTNNFLNLEYHLNPKSGDRNLESAP